MQTLFAMLAMFSDYCGIDTAPYVKVCFYPHEAGLGGVHQVVEDSVGNGFMKSAFVSEGPDIEFQRLEFYTEPIRNIFN